jgi:hypothetical protein
MLTKSEKMLSLCGLPELDRAIAPTRGYMVAIRGPCDGKDVIDVAHCSTLKTGQERICHLPPLEEKYTG